MSNKETIEMLIEGGKAVAGPAVGQKLGPLKINIGEVLQKINEKTTDFKGMKVPVKLIVDKDTKEYDIEVGLPPTSELIKNELKLQKGSGIPDKYKVGNISIEQVIKVAKQKKDGMYTHNIKSAVKSVIGSCNSLGILIESKTAPEIIKEVNKGKYDDEINKGKTETSEEKLKKLQDFLKKHQEENKAALEAEKEEEPAVVPVEGEAPKPGEAKTPAKEEPKKK